ncbi:hypothetical protein PIB30_070508 [Stylosanthes scabra]|uniref:TF-B3 domain-containing protein n=1 Tax=Stylosanthes scabra TaxID=79078 RepID=A0ABU6WLV2_9FABA|nr:hypothetical protein [Stylosanthes scabra]
MTSMCNLRNKKNVPNTILFFKIILSKTLQDGNLLPKSFTKKHGGGVPNPVYLKPSDGTEWKVHWTKHDGNILFEKGWKEFAANYSLDRGHLLMFEFNESSHVGVHICDMSGLEMELPFHGTQDGKDKNVDISDKAVEVFDEMPQSRNNRLKSPMSSPQPCKRLRTSGTAGEIITTHSLQNFPTQKELDEDICGLIQCPEVGKSSEETKALNKATTSKSRKNPSFMITMKQHYVNSYSMHIPLWFQEKCLKKRQVAAIILQILDGRTWPVGYNAGKFSSGWKKFASDNNLKVGDVCVFELTNHKILSFKVSISRAAQELSLALSKDKVEDAEYKPNIPRKDRKTIPRNSMVISRQRGTNVRTMEEAKKFTSENPVFKILIRPGFLRSGRPAVPTPFVRNYLKEKDIVQFQFGNKLWDIKLLKYKGKNPCLFSSGWINFAEENKLEAEDVCICELINIEDAVFDVHIFRRHR